MKRIIPIAIIGILLLSGIGASAFIKTEKDYIEQKETISFSLPKIHEKQQYTIIDLKEKTSYVMTTGEPMLPVLTKRFVFPFGTKIQDVAVTFSNSMLTSISGKIKPAPEPIPSTYKKYDSTKIECSSDIYSKDTFYPSQKWSINIGSGLNGLEHVLILSLKLFPIQYNPIDNVISYSDSAEIKILYDLPNMPIYFADEYDLLILTPQEFSDDLQDLVTHKEDMGLLSKLVTLDEIYTGEYFTADGRDDAEMIKYFIKNAVENWGVSYVLLIGGRSGGVMSEKWWLPVRYSYLDDGNEKSHASDLYFADIYDAGGNFSSWDSNEDDVFAEWTMMGKDILDMYPDVYVGRLACRNKNEVKMLVNKIINYETTTAGSEWFKKFVGISGDTYPGPADPYYEGEEANAAAFDLLDGFESDFVWTSTDTFTDADDVLNVLNDGCGFAHYSGHGNPAAWGNHPPHSDEFIDGPSVFDWWKLRNQDKVPVMVVGGCHNAQFNVSLLNILKGFLTDGMQYFSSEPPFGDFWHKEWVPECWGWRPVRSKNGGSIATIANTGLGYGIPGEMCLFGRGRFMEVQFFRSYSEGKTILGETHASDLMYYLDEFPPMEDQIDCKIVQQWVLLGDPSLMIGGYP